jgi:hypothetical protein
MSAAVLSLLYLSSWYGALIKRMDNSVDWDKLNKKWKFARRSAQLAQSSSVMWKLPDDMYDAVEAQYCTLLVYESLSQFIKGGRWHLSMNMEGLTKHCPAQTVYEYARPYKALTGTSCLRIWNALKSYWPSCNKKSSCLVKSSTQEETSQYPLRLTSADAAVDINNLYPSYLMFDTSSSDILTTWWWPHRDRNM